MLKLLENGTHAGVITFFKKNVISYSMKFWSSKIFICSNYKENTNWWNKNLDSHISRPWPELLPITVVSRYLYSHELFLPLLDIYCWLDSRMVNVYDLNASIWFNLIVTVSLSGQKCNFLKYFLLYFISLVLLGFLWSRWYEIWLYLNEF